MARDEAPLSSLSYPPGRVLSVVPPISFRFRFYPSPEQEPLLRRTIGCTRLVFNKALADRSAAWVNEKKSLSYVMQSAQLTTWKKTPELAFLNEVSCVPLQQALRHVDQAFRNFFAKCTSYPAFKKKKCYGGSAEFTQRAFRYDAATQTLTLAKMSAPLDVRWSRPLPPGVLPTTVTVSLDAAGRWHVSLLCEDGRIVLPQLPNAVGIDVGVTSLVTLSTGEKEPNPRHDERLMARKKLLQQRLARAQKGSKNREKTRRKLARLNAHIADCRRDHLHKLSTRRVRENQTIVVEDLSVKNMVSNRRLARVIYDAGWSALFRMLTYKSAWYGRDLVKIDRSHPSSKRCSCCGHVLDRLPLDVRYWTCPACGVEHDRDVNAARNILAAGLAVTACGPDVRQRILWSMLQLGVKQENPSVKKGISAL
jgi:putative transposase